MATRIFVDGSVYSPVDPYATALLTEDGVVRWVGSDAGAHSIADESTEVVELEGALLTPAFARALAPVGGKEPVEILEYLDIYRAVGYHTHTLLASMDDAADLMSALHHNIEEHGPADIRLILDASGPRVEGRGRTGVDLEELVSAIKALRPLTEGPRALPGLSLTGIHVPAGLAERYAQVAEDAALVLSIDASEGFAAAAKVALLIRGERPWLPIRLDAAYSTAQDPISDEWLQKLAEGRVHLGLSVCEPESDEADEAVVQALATLAAGGEGRESVASVARRANAAGTSIALGSDTQLFAPGAWALVRALVNDEHGVSARSAFAALTRGVYRLAHEENPFMGQLAPDTPAFVTRWRVEALMVQAPDSRVASWSTDLRARIPLLPVLDEQVELPILESIYTESK